jgi:hypothetical protein
MGNHVPANALSMMVIARIIRVKLNCELHAEPTKDVGH